MKSIRARILISSIAATLSVLLFMTIVSFVTVRSFLRENLIETTHYRLRIAMDTIDKDVYRLVQLVNWYSLNPEIVDYTEDAARDDRAGKAKALSAHRSLRGNMYANGLDSYIEKLVIGDYQGHSIQIGNTSGHTSDYAEALRLYEGSAYTVDEKRGWPGILESPFYPANDVPIIPIGRRIYGFSPRDPIGFVCLAVDARVIWSHLVRYDFEEGTRLFIAIGDKVYDITDRRSFAPVDIDPGILRTEPSRGGIGHADVKVGGKMETLVVYAGENSSWIVAQTLPVVQFNLQDRVFFRLILLMAGTLVLLMLIIQTLLERGVNRPIAHINRRVALIAKGDFSRDPSIESDNEIGNIGRAVNRMCADIEGYIADRLRDEKLKKSLEFRMLQNQINPHFLYNTLNTIKWMAALQKAKGIEELTGSLSTLLRHAARGTDELVPLSAELELVREYCTIQSYRSADLFTLDCDIRDESALAGRVLKFTLQPLVENAIMHGIEPKGRSGTIRITAVRTDSDLLRIEVTDDGVGIPQEKLSAVLRHGEGDKKAFNHIGLGNVDERIKLAFGEAYGLSVASEEGKFTTMTVTLPYSVGEEA